MRKNPWAILALCGSSVLFAQNGVVDPSYCGMTSPPSWCSGTEIGGWVTAAMKSPACGTGTNFFPSCSIVIPPNPAGGAYNQTTPINVPASTTTEQTTFSLIFTRGATFNFTGSTNSKCGTVDSICIEPSINEGSHVVIQDAHINLGSGAASGIHSQMYGAYLIRPAINGYNTSQGSDLWLDGGGAEIDHPSLSLAESCIKLTSTSGRQPNAIHVWGGEFDGCSYGWYHDDDTNGFVHLGGGNLVKGVTMEDVQFPVVDTGFVGLTLEDNYIEGEQNTAFQLGGGTNQSYNANVHGNVFNTPPNTVPKPPPEFVPIGLTNVYFSQIGPNTDVGNPKYAINYSDGSAQNAIIGNDEMVTVTALSALGSGGTAACDTVDGYVCTSKTGVIRVVTGTGPAGGDLFQMYWPTSFSTPAVCQFQVLAPLQSMLIAKDPSFNYGYQVKAWMGSAPSGTFSVSYICGS